MDHDSLPLKGVEPTSSRPADVLNAYMEIVRLGLDAMEEQIEHDPCYDSNEEGHFAWDVSLLVRAACLAWRITGDRLHIRRAARWAHRLCQGTDRARGVRDWRGRSGPVWSAGSRYTAATATVGIVDGKEIRLQGAADTVAIERPSSTTARVWLASNGEWVWQSPEGSLRPTDESYLPDLLPTSSAVLSVQFRGLREPVDLTNLEARSYPLQAQRAPHLVHTGLIARALLLAAEAFVDAREDAPDLYAVSTDFKTAAESAIAFHDTELLSYDSQPWYVTPEDFPGRRIGLALPHNHVADVATCHLLLAQHHRDKDRLELARSLAQPFLQEVDRHVKGELPHPWYYYPIESGSHKGLTRRRPMAERVVRAVPRAEDSSHATLRVRALAEWNAIDAGLVSQSQMSAVSRSFRNDFSSRSHGVPTLRWLPGDEDDAPRRGLSDTFAGAWGALYSWDNTLKCRLNELAYHHPPHTAFGATVLSAAEMVAMNSRKTIYAYGGQIAPE